MKTDYFRCRVCGEVKEFMFEEGDIPPACTAEECDVCLGGVDWDRMWSPPSLGRGSNGEPPR